MKSAREVILNNGNKGKEPRKGRKKGERNKITRFMEIIGKENYDQICRQHVETALYSDDADLRSNAQRFIMSLGEPKPTPLPHETYVEDVTLLPMTTIENIKQNESILLQKICDGDICMEVGERFFSLIEQARKTWECTEGVKLHDEMKQMVEDIKSR